MCDRIMGLIRSEIQEIWEKARIEILLISRKTQKGLLKQCSFYSTSSLSHSLHTRQTFIEPYSNVAFLKRDLRNTPQKMLNYFQASPFKLKSTSPISKKKYKNKQVEKTQNKIDTGWIPVVETNELRNKIDICP